MRGRKKIRAQWALTGIGVLLGILPVRLDGQEASNPAPPGDNTRKPADEQALREWLTNMVTFHRFTTDEVAAATGLEKTEIAAAVERLDVDTSEQMPPAVGEPLRVLPYPGGRHPRIGFLEGALAPQRETKISVFTPWDAASYVVVDVPEAIWSNLGLTYLAHTHIHTIWTKQNVELQTQEWDQRKDGTLRFERTLPNRIAFGTLISPAQDHVAMEMWLTNGTEETLTDLRVQNCVMLKAAKGFETQTNANKLFRKPFVVARNEAADRWIITAWEPCHRPWANAPVPCLHSDPKFPDCKPGETQRLKGWLAFYEGKDIEDELSRLGKKWLVKDETP